MSKQKGEIQKMLNDEVNEIKKKSNKRLRTLRALQVSASAYALIVVSLLLVNSFSWGYGIGLSEGLDFGNVTPTIHGHILVTKNNAVIWSEHNVITDNGRLDICDYIGGTAGASFDYIAIGSGSGGGASSTTLVTEEFRAQGTFAEPVAYNWTITYTWIAGTFSGEIITEAGVLNAAAAGTLLNYQDFTGITLTAADSLQVQFEFMVTSG